MKQGTTLVAKENFSMRELGARGRAVQVRVGDRFIVTTTAVWNSMNPPKIAREKNAMLGCGYSMDIVTINQLFNVE